MFTQHAGIASNIEVLLVKNFSPERKLESSYRKER